MKKKGCLGCSFPLVITIGVITIALFAVGFIAGPIGKAVLPSAHEALPHWMIVPLSEITLPAHPVFYIGSFGVTNSIIAGWITTVVIFLIFFFATRKSKLIPGKFQNLVEWFVNGMMDFFKNVGGEENTRRFFPFVGSIFLFVMVNAWMNLIPGFGWAVHEGGEPFLRGANTDINVPLALALYSFVGVTYVGFKTHKAKFAEQYLNFRPLGKGFKLLFTGKFKPGITGILNGFVAAVVGILELLSYFIRIISFTFRLFGNMLAGEILILMLTFLFPYIVSIAGYGLEFLVGLIQALIFSSLTMVFLTMAAAPLEGEHGH
ncbi:MAG: F0F1 ATP synthase subunit A [Dehalococcoidales bacterium]|nr:F0F1 ATP synthase subunit A [Dehalococcoidales bacterium]